MISKTDEDALDDRLKNWGRWIAGRKVSRTTMIYRLMVAAGEVQLDPAVPSKIDMADALLVDRAWRMLPQQPIRYWAAKNTLIAQFAFPQLSVRAFCDWVRQESRIQFHLQHPLRLNSKDYEVLLKIAKYEIFNLLTRIDRTSCNPEKNEYDD